MAPLLISPHEIAIGGVYFPPGFIAALLGLVAAMFTSGYLNKKNLSKHLYYPPIVMVALVIIYTLIIGLIIPF